MITKVEIERFKGLEHICISLDRINVLVGPNNAGKSSIIQALQLATSVAQASRIYAPNTNYKNNIKATSLAQEQLIYAPSKDVYALGHNGVLSDQKAKGINITIFEEEDQAQITLYKGKNKNIAVNLVGCAIGEKMESLDNPYCMYVTGLAGIPFQEEMRVVGAVRRSAAKGDSNTVFRNILYLLSQSQEKWEQFLKHIHNVFPDIDIKVTANPEVDGVISVIFSKGDEQTYHPIDLAGTGVLQAIQISAYINYFHPKLLLLDEPDSHLHPNNQKELANLLMEVTQDTNTQIIISTHSRFLMSALQNDAKFFLVRAGAIAESEYSHYIGLLELGALDSIEELRSGKIKYVVLTEDSQFDKTKMMQHLLNASGYCQNEYSILSYDSISKIDSALMFARFLLDFNPELHIIIHRDRDGLLPDEYTQELHRYGNDPRIHVFITLNNDMEMYFCNAEHIEYICHKNGYDLPKDEIAEILDSAIEAVKEKSHDKCLNNYVGREKNRKNTDYAEITRKFELAFQQNTINYIYGKTLRGVITAELQKRTKANIKLIDESNYLVDSNLQSFLSI